MSANYNKIIFGDKTLIDLTGDTVTAGTMLKGATTHDKSGAAITGTCTYDSDTTDATVSVAEILEMQTAYARGAKITGTMVNNSGMDNKTITSITDKASIAIGYHDGSGSVTIDSKEAAKLIPANIKKDITVLGVTGTYGGEAITAQQKTVTPGQTELNVLPDAGYDYLSSVTVKAIPYVEAANTAGGLTVTIG